jgi:hypothetical protein
MARTSEPSISVDEFGKSIQRSSGLYGLSVNDFTTFLALRLSKVHWTVGGARETKWGTGDHIRKQVTIPGPYREFLRGIRKLQLVGIVTTNYDIVVEKILGPTSGGRLGGFRYCDANDANEPLVGRHSVSSQFSYGPVIVNGRIPFLKLHGSLSWGLSSERKVIKYIDTRPSRGRRYTALVLPPGDSDGRVLIDDVWQDAGRVLREANIWIICGYSLPDYDDDIRQLVKSSAKEGQRIVVMDKTPHAICQKLRRLLVSPHRHQSATNP